MCGLNFTPVEEKIKVMNLAIHHRGFRDKYIFKDGFAFGHVRLPIQGLSEEFDQPYEYKDKLFLFVGEIYNYKEITPGAESDIQTLAWKYEMMGVSCLAKFDGMYSILIYDWSKDTPILTIVTDPLGKKPLYLHTLTGSVSSEIKALMRLEDGIHQDWLYFSSVLKWGYPLGDHTFCKNILKLRPGVIYQFPIKKEMIKGPGIIRYPNTGEISITPRSGGIRKNLEMAVRNRLVSDVPVSLLLSGGVDSSIIYKIMEKITHDFTIFHIDNQEEQYLEDLKIPSDIKVIQIPELRLSPGGIALGDEEMEDEVNKLSEILFYNEGTSDLGSMVPQFLLAQEIAKHGIHVCLSGDGADELFGGYTRISDYDSQYSDVFEELPNYHLPRLDKLMMAHTIEIRCPYLSGGVIQEALSWPYEDRIHKIRLKGSFSDIIPRNIYNRKKKALKSYMVTSGGIRWRKRLDQIFREKTYFRYYDPLI